MKGLGRQGQREGRKERETFAQWSKVNQFSKYREAGRALLPWK